MNTAMTHSQDSQVGAMELQRLSTILRLNVLEMTCRAGLGHLAPDFSCLDILTALYFKVLRVDPDNPGWPERDRFVISKGHAAGALYSVLAACGFFPEEWLDTYQQFGTRLAGHPDRKRTPGVEHNTGALGHGLSVGVGMAAGLAYQREGREVPRVYVLLGDGELQEGSNWEAAMLASHLKLGHLTAIVDRNGLQQGGRTKDTVGLEDLSAKWRSFGWRVVETDGHCLDTLPAVLADSGRPGQSPKVVIARTVKGYGVSFMAGRPEWHHRIPTAAEEEAARRELEKRLAELKAVGNSR